MKIYLVDFSFIRQCGLSVGIRPLKKLCKYTYNGVSRRDYVIKDYIR